MQPEVIIKQNFDQCPRCNYEWKLSLKGKDFFDGFGEKIIFRKNCPSCGYVYPKTKL